MRFIIYLILIVSTILPGQNKPANGGAIFGYLRAWHQSEFQSNSGEFLIKMARVGVKGNVNEFASYKVLIDFIRPVKLNTDKEDVAGQKVITGISNYSDMLLDAVATISPAKSFKISLGQFKVPFSTDNLLSAAAIDFVNRPLLTNVAPGLRDIGLMCSYSANIGIPFSLDAGIFNGTGQNKSENDKTNNFSLRTKMDLLNNLSFSANYYNGSISNSDVSIFDLGTKYSFGDFAVIGEYAARNSTPVNGGDFTSSSFFLYSYYRFSLENEIVQSIIPAIRYEHYDPNTSTANNNITKVTIGTSFNFAKITFAHFRINYELFDYEDGRINPDKIIFEVQTKF